MNVRTETAIAVVIGILMTLLLPPFFWGLLVIAGALVYEFVRRKIV